MSQGIWIIVTGPGGPGGIGEAKPTDWKVDIRYNEYNVVTSISITKHPWHWFKSRSHYTGPQERKFESEPDRAEWQGSKVAETYCPNADLGHADAQLYIADIHYQGAFGHKVDLVRAWVWYGLAAQSGDAQASEQLRRVTSELTSEQLQEAERQFASWKPGQCMQEMAPVQMEQDPK